MSLFFRLDVSLSYTLLSFLNLKMEMDYLPLLWHVSMIIFIIFRFNPSDDLFIESLASWHEGLSISFAMLLFNITVISVALLFGIKLFRIGLLVRDVSGSVMEWIVDDVSDDFLILWDFYEKEKEERDRMSASSLSSPLLLLFLWYGDDGEADGCWWAAWLIDRDWSETGLMDYESWWMIGCRDDGSKSERVAVSPSEANLKLLLTWFIISIGVRFPLHFLCFGRYFDFIPFSSHDAFGHHRSSIGDWRINVIISRVSFLIYLLGCRDRGNGSPSFLFLSFSFSSQERWGISRIVI